MENNMNMHSSTFGLILNILGTSPLVPVFLSLTPFAKDISQKYYSYGVLAAGTLLGFSLYMVSRIKRARNDEELSSFGDLSRGISTVFVKIVSIVLMAVKYVTLLMIIDVFINVLFSYFPFLDEVRKSLAIYRILFGFGIALVGFTLYMFSTKLTNVFLIVSILATTTFVFALVAGYFLGVNSITQKHVVYSTESHLSLFFWITTLSFYSMEFISGGTKILGKSTTNGPSSDRYIALFSTVIISAIYLTIISSAGWILSSRDSLSVIDALFSESSRLNSYLTTSTIDRYAMTSTVMCMCLPIICITLFVTQLDVFIESLKNVTGAGCDSKLLMFSLLIVGIQCVQSLFSELTATLNLYLLALSICVTPLLADYPFVCHLVTSKKISLFSAICMLATLFTCALMVGTAKTLMDILKDN